MTSLRSNNNNSNNNNNKTMFEYLNDEKEILNDLCSILSDPNDAQSYQCTVCYSLKTNNINTPCVHLICKDCYVACGKQECPTCKQNIGHHPALNGYLNNRVNMLIVKCPNAEYGCEEKCTLSRYLNQHIKECKFQMVHCINKKCKYISRAHEWNVDHECSCSFDGCTVKLPVTQLEIHKQDVHTKTPCLYCNEQYTRKEMIEHYNQLSVVEHSQELLCTSLVPCPLKCTQNNQMVYVHKNHLNDHMDSDCPQRQLNCAICDRYFPFSEASSHFNFSNNSNKHTCNTYKDVKAEWEGVNLLKEEQERVWKRRRSDTTDQKQTFVPFSFAVGTCLDVFDPQLNVWHSARIKQRRQTNSVSSTSSSSSSSSNNNNTNTNDGDEVLLFYRGWSDRERWVNLKLNMRFFATYRTYSKSFINKCKSKIYGVNPMDPDILEDDEFNSIEQIDTEEDTEEEDEEE